MLTFFRFLILLILMSNSCNLRNLEHLRIIYGLKIIVNHVISATFSFDNNFFFWFDMRLTHDDGCWHFDCLTLLVAPLSLILLPLKVFTDSIKCLSCLSFSFRWHTSRSNSPHLLTCQDGSFCVSWTLP